MGQCCTSLKEAGHQRSWTLSHQCPAFHFIFHLSSSSFEAGIANAISSFKWRKIWLSVKTKHVWKFTFWLTNHLSQNYFIDYSAILFPLKLTRNRIYTAPAAQRLTHMMHYVLASSNMKHYKCSKQDIDMFDFIDIGLGKIYTTYVKHVGNNCNKYEQKYRSDELLTDIWFPIDFHHLLTFTWPQK